MGKYLLLFIIISLFKVSAKEIVPMYTYHQKAPFIFSLDRELGISFTLVELLNRYSKKYQFKLVYLPRKRLDLVKTKKIVLWTNPSWMNDIDETRFLWSQNLVRDSEIFISLKKTHFKYKSNKDLHGKKLIGVAGYVYPIVETLVENEKVIRVNVKSEKQILSMVSSDRGGIGVLSYSTLMYYLNRSENLRQKIDYSNDVKTSFFRRISATKDSKAQFLEVNKILSMKEFRKIFKKEAGSYFLDLDLKK